MRFLQVKPYAKFQHIKQIKSRAQLWLQQGWDPGYPPLVSPKQTWSTSVECQIIILLSPCDKWIIKYLLPSKTRILTVAILKHLWSTKITWKEFEQISQRICILYPYLRNSFYILYNKVWNQVANKTII